MQRLAILLIVITALCPPVSAQETPATRFGVTARFIPNSGNPVTATIPDAMIGNVTVPLQIAPASTLLLSVNPAKTEGEVSISVSDTALVRPPAGTTPSAPVIVMQGTFQYTFGRPVTVLQTGTYRIEVLLTRL